MVRPVWEFNMIRIIHIVGARPNFMKIAPIIREMSKQPDGFEQILVHTGQHYDDNMSNSFFNDLKIPEPEIHLGVGSGSQSEQTARIMLAFEPVAIDRRPDLVVVVGDVNSTLACSLVAAKLDIGVAHVEAGLRSFDRTMPEEINRTLTDQLSDFLFVSEPSGLDNLRQEGCSEDKIYFVGNVMIDTLMYFRHKAARSAILDSMNLTDKTYILLTLHRPSNVDSPEIFEKILSGLTKISQHLPIIFPSHPRTRKMISKFNLDKYFKYSKAPLPIDPPEGILLVDPLGYLDFLKMMTQAKIVLTDSGGIQEETTILGVPCLTLRENTERPITVSEGTNTIVGTNPDTMVRECLKILNHDVKKSQIPQLWDGHAAERIVRVLARSATETK
jgi:UDP-N-acetylglucosamine 2-epimerase (non-hydrolysing)